MLQEEYSGCAIFIRMKALFLLIVLAPLATFSQDCKLIHDKDPYTREMKSSTGFISLQGASVTVDADSKELDFFFTIAGKCFNDASTVFIYFEGAKSKTTYRNAGSMNCDGYFHFRYKNAQAPNAILKKLMELPVAQFVFMGSDKKEIVVTLQPDQQKQFMQAVNCLVNDAKTLIK